MKKRILLLLGLLFFLLAVPACGKADEHPEAGLTDGTYQAAVVMEGGSGKAYIESPAELTVTDGDMFAELVWSSPNYDYMKVDGTEYDNENEGGNSTFTIPVESLDTPFTVIGDTTAMSTPHEIEYTLTLSIDDETGGEGNSSAEDAPSDSSDTADVVALAGSGGTEFTAAIEELSNRKPIKLQYAQMFTIRRIPGYSLLTTGQGEDTQYFLIVHENSDGEAYSGLTESEVSDEPFSIDTDRVTVLQRPVENTYLVSSPAMDFIDKLGCMGNIRLSGIKETDWYIDGAAEAMEDGEILYAGKYSAPDYELILSEGCELAIENTMILHNPEVKEKLEELGIPVLIDRSSYEDSPLARLEWIKVYGELFGKEKGASDYFDSQAEVIGNISGKQSTGRSIAYFSVNSNGSVVVRKSGDYIAKMIDMAGGSYVPDSTGREDDSSLSTVNMQFEDFYAAAAEADILIYNSAIEGEISDIRDLISKNGLFADFDAVKSGQVYCCGKNFYQQITGMTEFMKDINNICLGNDTDLTYLTKLN